MDKFLHDENLRLFRKLLAETTDEKQRQVLRELIADKRQNFASGKPNGGLIEAYQFFS